MLPRTFSQFTQAISSSSSSSSSSSAALLAPPAPPLLPLMILSQFQTIGQKADGLYVLQQVSPPPPPPPVPHSFPGVGSACFFRQRCHHSERARLFRRVLPSRFSSPPSTHGKSLRGQRDCPHPRLLPPPLDRRLPPSSSQ
eukprot:758678-Hanusia_phi.AAC.1